MKKSNKKIISLLLAVMMAFAITACSSGGQGASQGADQAKPSGEGQTTQALPQQTNLQRRRKQPLPQPKSLPRKRKLPYHRLLQHQLQKKPLNRQNQSITSLW